MPRTFGRRNIEQARQAGVERLVVRRQQLRLDGISAQLMNDGEALAGSDGKSGFERSRDGVARDVALAELEPEEFRLRDRTAHGGQRTQDADCIWREGIETR